MHYTRGKKMPCSSFQRLYTVSTSVFTSEHPPFPHTVYFADADPQSAGSAFTCSPTHSDGFSQLSTLDTVSPSSRENEEQLSDETKQGEGCPATLVRVKLCSAAAAAAAATATATATAVVLRLLLLFLRLLLPLLLLRVFFSVSPSSAIIPQLFPQPSMSNPAFSGLGAFHLSWRNAYGLAGSYFDLPPSTSHHLCSDA